MVASLDTHRQSVQLALADLRAWGGRLEETAQQHADADRPWRVLAENRERELSAGRSDQALLRQELDASRQSLAELERRLQREQARAAELAVELAESRGELEAVIDRSAQVAEDAGRQRRQAAAERAGYEAEIKALRQLFVQQQELVQPAEPCQHPAQPAGFKTSASAHAPLRSRTGKATPAATETSDPQDSNISADPVLVAVVAQFDELKRAQANSPRLA